MKTKWPKILAAILLFAIALWAIVRPQDHPVRPSLTLPEGSTLVLEAVTYGTNHVVGSALAKIVAKLPLPVQGLARTLFGTKVTTLQLATTPTPSLKLWLYSKGTNAAGSTSPSIDFFMAFLADESGFVSGKDYWLYPVSVGQNTVDFPVFPRREKEITLRLFRRSGEERFLEYGSMRFQNPVFKDYPQWKPEALPAVKRSGHLVATLGSFLTGRSGNVTYKTGADGKSVVDWETNRLDHRNYSVGDIAFLPEGRTNEVWQVTGVEVSDPTGNVANNNSMSWGGNGQSFSFMPSLWPSESAWKVKLEIKRSAGFDPEEMFVFQDVPLPEEGKTNRLSWTTNVSGGTITLREVTRRTVIKKDSWSSQDTSNVVLTHFGFPEGMHLDLLTLVCDTGETNASNGWSSTGSTRSYHYRDLPLNAKSATLTFAIQKSRKMEFLVKPALVP